MKDTRISYSPFFKTFLRALCVLRGLNLCNGNHLIFNGNKKAILSNRLISYFP